jgi:CheY-like chemotaxis protein
MLEYLGYRVSSCGNGAEAIAQYKAARESGSSYSAVIMDLTIPGGMGGKEAAEQILAIDPQACLIVSSGYSNDPIMSEHCR